MKNRKNKKQHFVVKNSYKFLFKCLKLENLIATKLIICNIRT